jgi:hypothetical protein
MVLLVFLFEFQSIREKYLKFCYGLSLLLGVIIISALINSAGIINIFLEFLLLAEPFLFFLIILNFDNENNQLMKFGKWIIFFGLIHVPLAYFQWFTKWTDPFLLRRSADSVCGTLFGMYAGSHVMVSVVFVCVLFIFKNSIIKNKLIRYLIIFSALPLAIMADAKSVPLAFLIAFLIVAITKIRNPIKILKYISIFAILCFLAYGASVRFYGSNIFFLQTDYVSKGLTEKFVVFSVFSEYLDSPFSWIFGAGPGHTVGRLGFLMPNYWNYIGPLGATISPITAAVWESHHWTAWVTSLFSPMFSWAGVIGDIGIVGTIIYLYLFIWVYKKYCHDDINKICLVALLVFGLIFEWMEEPNLMLYAMAVIATRWLIYQSKLKLVHQQSPS